MEMPIAEMIFQRTHENCWRRTGRDAKVPGAGLRRITMFINAVFGSYARAHPGGMYRRIMVVGATRTVVLSAGAT